MDPRFPNWYRSAEVNADGKRLDDAWNLAEGLSRSLDVTALLKSVAFAFGLDFGGTWPHEMNPQIIEIDPSFAVDDRRHEVAVLTICAALVRLMSVEDGDSEERCRIALAARCAGFKAVRAISVVPDLASEAELYLEKLARKVRERPNVLPPQAPFQGVAEKIKAAHDHGFNSQGYLALEQSVSALNESAIAQSRALYEETIRLRHLVQLQAEETEMLWWLLVRRHEMPRRPKGHPGSVAICLAAQLVDATVASPGPPCVGGLLAIALKDLRIDGVSPVALNATVSGAARDWRSKVRFPKDAVGEFLCPISAAIQMSLAFAKDDGWADQFRHRAGLDSAVALSPLDLATQFYDEQLLLGLCG